MTTDSPEQLIFIILAQINEQTSLEQSIFIFLGQRAIKEQSRSNQALREHSESTKKIRVIQSEPKILCLV